MKALQLVLGLVFLACMGCSVYAGLTAGSHGAVCLHTLFGALNAGFAANLLCKALIPKPE